MNGRSSALRRAVGISAVALVVLMAVPYAWAPIYTFPPAEAFRGAQLWNPYQAASGTWQRANLHAHGRAWFGLTSGEQADAIVANHYRELGYAVAGVSDYQYIAAFHGIDTLPLYEHGFNVGKNHQLAIGAHAVEWFDFPLWQSTSHQQYVIDRVRAKTELIAINHPGSRNAYDAEALRTLTGVNLVEIANGPFVSEDVWDAALSGGRPVWGMANDDTHDLTDVRRNAAAWTMIDAPTASASDIISALRAGRSYAVLRTGAIEAAGVTTLSSMAVADGTLTVTVAGAPSTISFIGQNGVVRSVSKDTHSAAYTMADDDTYIRAVVHAPQTVMYLNPVLRWDGKSLPAPAATVNVALTWIQRGAALLVAALLVARTRARQRASRPSVVASVASPAGPISRA